MSRNVFVVVGSTGEYSDRREWLVRAFTSEDAAKGEVVRLSELARIYGEKKEEVEDFFDISYDQAKHAAWKDANVPGLSVADPDFHMDYTGTSYHYAAVPLEEA